MSEDYSKKTLRKTVKAYRAAITAADKEVWDARLLERVKALGWDSADTVYSYVSVKGEAETGLINQWLIRQGVRVAVPLVVKTDAGKRMKFYYITGPQDLEPGVFGLLEPKKTCAAASSMDCPVLVPGVAFSREGYRVGYGGGFYDHFFEDEPHHLTCALAYDFQIFPEVERGPYDLPVQRILTPEHAYPEL